MYTLSRAPLRALALTLLTAAAVAGCGGTTVTTADSPTATTSPSAPAATPTTSSSASAAAGNGRAQVVQVEKYGISFELPRSWITLNAKKVLEGGGKNPFLDEMADRLGATREQLVQSFSTYVQTLSVSGEGAVHGFLDNVNSVGQDSDVNDDQLKLQLATIGAKPNELDHVTTDAGDVTRIPYDLRTKVGGTIRGVTIAVHTGDTTVVITVSSSSAKRADLLADQIQASLRKIPGTGPSL